MSACHIEGCVKEVRGWGLCSTHWLRWRKWGDPYWVTPPKSKGRICEVEGCDAKHHAHGFCADHAARFKRHGDPLGTRSKEQGRPPKTGTTGYAGAHKRIQRERGSADLH